MKGGGQCQQRLIFTINTRAERARSPPPHAPAPRHRRHSPGAPTDDGAAVRGVSLFCANVGPAQVLADQKRRPAHLCGPHAPAPALWGRARLPRGGEPWCAAPARPRARLLPPPRPHSPLPPAVRALLMTRKVGPFLTSILHPQLVTLVLGYLRCGALTMDVRVICRRPFGALLWSHAPAASPAPLPLRSGWTSTWACWARWRSAPRR